MIQPLLLTLFARLLGCYASRAQPTGQVSRPLVVGSGMAGAGSTKLPAVNAAGPSSSPAPAAHDPRAAFAHALVSHRRTPYAKGARQAVYDARHAMLRAELGR